MMDVKSSPEKNNNKHEEFLLISYTTLTLEDSVPPDRS